ncbi:hypothetical protein THAOC_11676 [Thalassiosira oceanica]|uniref:Uncharacterized protein n=1 Tax=Thalassiosira oceanica TaxID=159749 RepID=K0SQN7_THAOC|nr:hypothetical protein THAOC_11676 [Thalassiosira oceanica]|eukprot:EJK67309.1 hypothetical protein THAOC_11676 [Thalassiosira oceanica]
MHIVSDTPGRTTAHLTPPGPYGFNYVTPIHSDDCMSSLGCGRHDSFNAFNGQPWDTAITIADEHVAMSCRDVDAGTMDPKTREGMTLREGVRRPACTQKTRRRAAKAASPAAAGMPGYDAIFSKSLQPAALPALSIKIAGAMAK